MSAVFLVMLVVASLWPSWIAVALFFRLVRTNDRLSRAVVEQIIVTGISKRLLVLRICLGGFSRALRLFLVFGSLCVLLSLLVLVGSLVEPEQFRFMAVKALRSDSLFLLISVPIGAAMIAAAIDLNVMRFASEYRRAWQVFAVLLIVGSQGSFFALKSLVASMLPQNMALALAVVLIPSFWACVVLGSLSISRLAIEPE